MVIAPSIYSNKPFRKIYFIFKYWKKKKNPIPNQTQVSIYIKIIAESN